MEADSRMEWTCGQTKQLIAAFRKRDFLWVPNQFGYRDRTKKNEAWRDIANEIGQAEDHCKRKMDSLLASFRRERFKMAKSIEEGDPPEKAYHAKWKFYPLMLFMLRATNADDAEASAVNQDSSIPSNSDDEIIVSPAARGPTKGRFRKRKRYGDSKATPSSVTKSDRRLRGAVESPSTLWYDNVNISAPFEEQQHQPSSNLEDSFDIFGKYVASELRGLDVKVLATVKHQISTAIFEAKVNMHGSSNIVVISDEVGL